MRSARQPLEFRDDLLWVRGLVERSDGVPWIARFVLDTGTAHTALSTDFAAALGFGESKKVGVANFDSIDGTVQGYTVRLPRISFLGRQKEDYLVGCKPFYSRLDVPGILGLDFLLGTDTLLSLRKKMSIHLAW